MKCPGKENEWNDQHWEDILIFGQILSNSTVRNIWRTVKRIYMLILGLKVQSGSQSSIFCSGPNPGSWHLSANTAVGKRAKNVFPGVLTIYIGDAKILIGKSNGSRHCVWGASENMSCDLRGWNFSTRLICSSDLNLHCRVQSPTKSNFLVYVYAEDFHPGLVWVNGKHTCRFPPKK